MNIALTFATLLSCTALAGHSFANDWQPARVGDLHMDREGSPAAIVGGIFDAGGQHHTGTLAVSCIADTTVVSIQSRQLHLGITPVPVKVALDDGPAQSASWDACANGACIGLWSGKGIPFLRSLLAKNDLKVVIDRQFGPPIVASFRVAGAEAGLLLVGEKCGWIGSNP